MRKDIVSDFNVSKLAVDRAIQLNAQWRKETFSSERRVKERLRQALAVSEDASLPDLRGALRERLKHEIESHGHVILTGEDGRGKSWISAQLCAEAEGLALFISAERFDGIEPDTLTDFLIDLLVKQTGEVADETLKSRWRHRFNAWKTSPPLYPLLVVIDGINQRQEYRWDHLLNAIRALLSDIGSSLVVTVRPLFFSNNVKQGLDFVPNVIEIPNWLPTERDDLLMHYRVSQSWLDTDTLQVLQNPRLLNIAVKILPHDHVDAWKGLTIDRLMFEHLRASQRENFEPETYEQLTERLSCHAEEVFERVKTQPSSQSKEFLDNSTAVIETRFYRKSPGPGQSYKLHPDGLTLALGFALVDLLWKAHRAGEKNLSGRAMTIVEPISAIDRTADVLFASLLVCALDEEIRFDRAIFLGLLGAFASIQNVDELRVEEFVETVKQQPEAFFDVLENLCVDNEQRINHDWFIHAAFKVSKTDKGWEAADSTIRRWLNFYNSDATTQTSRYCSVSDTKYEETYLKRKKVIDTS